MTEITDQEIEAATMCFACGRDNPIGLHIDFHVDDDAVCTAEFTPTENHVGWQDTVHGGIIYAALDDVTANVLYQRRQKATPLAAKFATGNRPASARPSS